jgi:GNAT superfamily N-acetyltransferase
MTGSSESEREWSIREYREGDEDQILELRGIALSGSKDRQWWQWMYRDGPIGPAIITVAEAKGRIIGHTASILVPVKIGDRVTKGSHGIDLMVHPDYRHQGIFLAIHKKLNRAPSGSVRSIAYGTPNDQSRPGFVGKLNALNICEVPVLLKVIDWGMVLKNRYKIPEFAGRVLGNIWEHITHHIRSPKDAGIEVNEVSIFDEQIDKFWQKASGLKNIMIVKDMKYLNWRYVAKPGKEYRVFIAKKQQDIAGYIVLKLEKDALSRGYLIDLLILPGDDTVAELLITRAIRYFQEEKAGTISCWMLKDTPYYGTLKKLGFIRRPGPTLCARAFDPDIPKEFVTNPANWYYVLGDDDAK